MNRLGYIFLGLFFFLTQAWAAETSISVEGGTESDAMYPVTTQAVSGRQQGIQFLSLSGDIPAEKKDSAEMIVDNIDSDFFEWSYRRDAGSVPNHCPEGFGAAVGICAEICPEGYRGVLGACWEDCPQGFTDMGLFCTKWKWWPESQGKDVFGQKLMAKQCAEGMVNEAGLCYTPCEDSFTGVGPLCYGEFNNDSSVARINTQVEEQHQVAQAQSSTGGVVVAEEETPQITTDVAFTPIICSLDNPEALEAVFGMPLDLVSLAVLANDAANDAIVKSISDALAGDTNSAWLVPSLAQTVLFDFTADATCEDDGVVATAALNLNPSLTVQASTRMFDTALHNMAGVDLGIMSLSIYELIPFRIYGAVGADVGVDASLTSVLDRSLPAVVVADKQFADSMTLDIAPGLNFWLSVEAYIRITSFLNFIPDLMQLGAEFKLFVIDLFAPYHLEEGIRRGDEGYEAFKNETFAFQFASGHGYIDVFLRILGVETGAFDSADLQWEGFRENQIVIDKEESELIDL